MRSQRIFGAGALAAMLLVPMVAPASPRPSGPVTVAANKQGIACNEIVANQITDKVRDFDKHPPSPTDRAALTARYDALDDVLGEFQREDLVVRGVVCRTDNGRGPIEAKIAAGAAWAMALQADLLAEIWATQCPAAAHDLPASVIADAWVSLAEAMPGAPASDYPTPAPGPNGAPPTPQPTPQAIAEVIPKIQSRAAALNLDLPDFPDASDYWARGIRQKADADVATCPAPAPAPTPTK